MIYGGYNDRTKVTIPTRSSGIDRSCTQIHLYFRINVNQENTILYLFPFAPKYYSRNCASFAQLVQSVLEDFLDTPFKGELISRIHSAARFYLAHRIIVTSHECTRQKANLIFKVAVNHTRRDNNPPRVLVNARAVFVAEGNVFASSDPV